MIPVYITQVAVAWEEAGAVMEAGDTKDRG
jgi:hypothetical protein